VVSDDLYGLEALVEPRLRDRKAAARVDELGGARGRVRSARGARLDDRLRDFEVVLIRVARGRVAPAGLLAERAAPVGDRLEQRPAVLLGFVPGDMGAQEARDRRSRGELLVGLASDHA